VLVASPEWLAVRSALAAALNRIIEDHNQRVKD